MDILGVVDIPLTLVLVVIVITFLYIYETWHFNIWRNLGIPGPTPRFLVGNIGLPFNSNVDLAEKFATWRKKYGRTFGIFQFRDPVFVTSDPEIIKEIAVKCFSNFVDRHNSFDRLVDRFTLISLFQAKGTAWRRHRQIMTPAFSSGKLRVLQSHVLQCSKALADVVTDRAVKGQDIELTDTYQKFTMDVIAGTAFGLDTNLQKGEERDTHHMVKAMRGILANVNIVPPIFLSVAFPFLAPVLRAVGYTTIPADKVQFFKQCLTDVIRHRDENKQHAEKRGDILQQMMDVRVAAGAKVTDPDTESAATRTNKRMTGEEVLAQGVQIFVAGFEPNTNTLRMLTYHLALHQDVQEKLHQEILHVIGQGELKYDHLQQLKYTECVILETLRLYPVIPSVTRHADRATDVKGYHIPQGVGVSISIFNATHDPDLYPDPYMFKPERFADGKDNFMASLPFGVGPRQCIGMRLAMQEMKTAVIHVCRAVRFVPCEKTPKVVKFDSWNVLLPKHPIHVRAQNRT